MAVAMCGGLVLNDDTLVVENKIITKPGEEPSDFVVANCGGVLFDGDLFKKVGRCITDIDADEEDVVELLVSQAGCGGFIVDSTYFEINEDGELVLKTLATYDAEEEDSEKPEPEE